MANELPPDIREALQPWLEETVKEKVARWEQQARVQAECDEHNAYMKKNRYRHLKTQLEVAELLDEHVMLRGG
jgi:hypothetical protein